MTDADGQVVTVTTIETTLDYDGLPHTIDCHTEQAVVTMPHPDDDDDVEGADE